MRESTSAPASTPSRLVRSNLRVLLHKASSASTARRILPSYSAPHSIAINQILLKSLSIPYIVMAHQVTRWCLSVGFGKALLLTADGRLHPVTTGRYPALEFSGSNSAANLYGSASARCPLLTVGLSSVLPQSHPWHDAAGRPLNADTMVGASTQPEVVTSVGPTGRPRTSGNSHGARRGSQQADKTCLGFCIDRPSIESAL